MNTLNQGDIPLNEQEQRLFNISRHTQNLPTAVTEETLHQLQVTTSIPYHRLFPGIMGYLLDWSPHSEWLNLADCGLLFTPYGDQLDLRSLTSNRYVYGQWHPTRDQFIRLIQVPTTQTTYLDRLSAQTYVFQRIELDRFLQTCILNPSADVIALQPTQGSLVLYEIDTDRYHPVHAQRRGFNWHPRGHLCASLYRPSPAETLCTIYTSSGLHVWSFSVPIRESDGEDGYCAWHPEHDILAVLTLETFFVVDVSRQDIMYRRALDPWIPTTHVPLQWNAQGTHLVGVTTHHLYLYTTNDRKGDVYSTPGITDISWHPSGQFFTMSRRFKGLESWHKDGYKICDHPLSWLNPHDTRDYERALERTYIPLTLAWSKHGSVCAVRFREGEIAFYGIAQPTHEP